MNKLTEFIILQIWRNHRIDCYCKYCKFWSMFTDNGSCIETKIFLDQEFNMTQNQALNSHPKSIKLFFKQSPLLICQILQLLQLQSIQLSWYRKFYFDWKLKYKIYWPYVACKTVKQPCTRYSTVICARRINLYLLIRA